MPISTVIGLFAVAIGCLAIALGMVLALRSLRMEDSLRKELISWRDASKLETQVVRDQAEELLAEARTIRNRENGRRGGRPPIEAEPKYHSADEYKRALERGAPRDPMTESALGWSH